MPRPILLLLALLGARPAVADLPLALQPECGTPDRPDLCPADLEQDWVLLSYVPTKWQALVRPDELATGTGVGADRAWRTSTGRTDVVLAVLDSGYFWDDTKVRDKIALNTGELPLPQDATGKARSTYDADGNGFVNVDDWAEDPRLDITAGQDLADGHLDGSDLLAAFSDGLDDDGNGYVDDIAGWDFFDDDNDPYDDTRYDHGTYEAREAAAKGNDGEGGIGPCPNCFILPLRVGDSFVADGSNFAGAVLYAVDNGASVVQEALGTINHPTYATAAISYAWDHDVLVVASAADEVAYHPNAPGWVERTLYVHAVGPDTDAEQATTYMAYSNCTNHGARLDLSTSAWGCSSGATAITSGVSGLVLSAARDRGIDLSAGELYQLMIRSIDDIDVPESQDDGSAYYPSKAGWDRYFGEGRLSAWQVVEAVAAGEIPPTAEWTDPDWFDLVGTGATVELRGAVAARAGVASWTVEVGEGVDPDAWTVIATGAGEADGTLATWDPSTVSFDPSLAIEDHPSGDDQVDREERVNRYTVTFKLTVTDQEGRTGRARRAIYVLDDPDALPGFPMKLGPSMEASPNLVDLDGDGTLDILLADADGSVHALRGDGSPLPGWPVRLGTLAEVDEDNPANHRAAPGWQALGLDLSPSIVASPAAGDLDGDGDVELVISTLRGELYALDHQGQVLPGFPFVQRPKAPTDEERQWDDGFFSSPALGDLDGDGDLEIVQAGMDQRLYALHHDGTEVTGWPVCPCWPDAGGGSGEADPADLSSGSRIISSPALGDVDGDGTLDIVIGTQETLSSTTGPIYAISGLGTADPRGAFLPGWPQSVFGAYTQALPYVGEGVPASPALADVDGDGDLELSAHTLAGDLPVFLGDGTELWTAILAADGYGSASNMNDAALFPLINSSSFGDLDGDGTPDLVTGGVGTGYALAQLQDGQRAPFDHGVGAWSGATGEYLNGWPRVIEDLQFFMNPAIADLDGDDLPEVISGSGGFMVHAWNVDGQQPDGWPKFTGQWVLGSPAVGDVDGDGSLDVVVVTRQGWVFAWRTTSPAGARVEWASFGHDPQNTGNYHHPLPDGYNTDVDDPAPSGAYAGGCGCGGGGGAAAGLAALGLLGLARRRRGT